LYATINDIVDSTRDLSSPYLTERGGKKSLYIVIAGDRGLAGGYNSNVLKLVTAQMQGREASVLPIGRKAVEYFQNRNVPCLTVNYAEAAAMSLGDCFSVAKQVCKRYLAGEYDEIYVAYTNFVSVLSQVPVSQRLLPLLPEKKASDCASQRDILYEPDCETVFHTIVPEYIGGVLYSALCESRASEQAARRTAMDSASQNADEMIADLSLKFNRARQAAITQEITEIVAGS
jgi:F-type H+-transporting ATPase subunit gamma